MSIHTHTPTQVNSLMESLYFPFIHLSNKMFIYICNSFTSIKKLNIDFSSFFFFAYFKYRKKVVYLFCLHTHRNTERCLCVKIPTKVKKNNKIKKNFSFRFITFPTTFFIYSVFLFLYRICVCVSVHITEDL